jgi:hypothetical protein
MSINRSRLLGLLCVLTTLSGYGCDDNKHDADHRVRGIGPSPISFSGVGEPATNSIDYFAHGVTLQPAVSVPQALTGAACPTRQPFQVPFRVVGTGHGRSDLFIDEVRVRFVDRAGVVGGAMTLARPQLAERFGSTQLPAVGTRAFPLTLPFGCVGQPVGTLEVVVLGGDSRERGVRRSSLSIDVR